MSFSATDYVGHRCGPHAIETMDMYLRLDLELERFFDALDDQVGEGNWTVFLTSDHGGATVPSYGQSIGLPVDYWSHGDMQIRIEENLDQRYGARNWLDNVSNNSIFISEAAYNWADGNANSPLDGAGLQRYIGKLALEEAGIIQSIAEVDLATKAAVDPIAERIYAGHMPGVSGDVLTGDETRLAYIWSHGNDTRESICLRHTCPLHLLWGWSESTALPTRGRTSEISRRPCVLSPAFHIRTGRRGSPSLKCLNSRCAE